MARLRREYGELLDLLREDRTAVEWLREYSRGWPPGSGPPRELPAVQSEIDRDLEVPRRPPLRLEDVRDSGRRAAGGAEIREYLAVWPALGHSTQIWGRSWETRLSLSRLGPVWSNRLRRQADELEGRNQNDMRSAFRAEWRDIQRAFNVGPMPHVAPVMPFNMVAALRDALGQEGWDGVRASVGEPAMQFRVRQAWAVAELFSVRAARPQPLPSRADLVALRGREAARRWAPDVRQQMFIGERRVSTGDGSSTTWRAHAGEIWSDLEGEMVPSLAVTDDVESKRVAGSPWGTNVAVTALRDCIAPTGAGDVWSASATCQRAVEAAHAGAIAALFERWRPAESPWAVGGTTSNRALCRGLSVSQLRDYEEGRGLVAMRDHDGTDEQHAQDIAFHDDGREAGGLSFSKEPLICARYALEGSGSVAFVRVDQLEGSRLHDYSTAEGGERLRRAASSVEEADRAARFAAADAEVRYDVGVPHSGIARVVDFSEVLGAEDAYQGGSKRDFVMSAGRALREETTVVAARVEGGSPVYAGEGGPALRMSLEEGATLSEGNTASMAHMAVSLHSEFHFTDALNV